MALKALSGPTEEQLKALDPNEVSTEACASCTIAAYLHVTTIVYM